MLEMVWNIHPYWRTSRASIPKGAYRANTSARTTKGLRWLWLAARGHLWEAGTQCKHWKSGAGGLCAATLFIVMQESRRGARINSHVKWPFIFKQSARDGGLWSGALSRGDTVKREGRRCPVNTLLTRHWRVFHRNKDTRSLPISGQTSDIARLKHVSVCASKARVCFFRSLRRRTANKSAPGSSFPIVD